MFSFSFQTIAELQKEAEALRVQQQTLKKTFEESTREAEGK